MKSKIISYTYAFYAVQIAVSYTHLDVYKRQSFFCTTIVQMTLISFSLLFLLYNYYVRTRQDSNNRLQHPLLCYSPRVISCKQTFFTAECYFRLSDPAFYFTLASSIFGNSACQILEFFYICLLYTSYITCLIIYYSLEAKSHRTI